MSLLTLWLLFVVLPGLRGLTPGLFACSTILIGIYGGWFIISLVEGSPHKPPVFLRNLGVFLLILASIISVTTPDKKSIMIIAGAYSVTNVEGIEKLPPNIVRAANDYLESLTNENK